MFPFILGLIQLLLDPSGVTPSLTRDEIAAHILAQAKRRAERDEKMFDY